MREGCDDDWDADTWRSDLHRSNRLIGGLNLQNLQKGVVFDIDENDSSNYVKLDEYLDDAEVDRNEDGKYFDWIGYRDKESIPDLPFDLLAEKMENMDEAGLIKKQIIKPGGGSEPPDNAFVIIEYQLFLDQQKEPFDSTRLRNKRCRFCLGKGQVLLGLDMAVRSMRTHEISRFLIDPQLAFGELGTPERIPPNATILADVELIKIIDKDSPDTMNCNYDLLDGDFANSMHQAKVLHTIANENSKSKFYKEAARKYRDALRILSGLRLKDSEEEQKMLKLKIVLLVNLAVTLDKLNKPEMVCIQCREALHIDPKNVKALFQFGRAHLKLSNFDLAEKYLIRGKNLCPDSKEFEEELKRLEEKKKVQQKRDNLFCKRFIGMNVNEEKKRNEKQYEARVRDALLTFMEEQKTGTFSLPGNLSHEEKEICKALAQEYKAEIELLPDKAVFILKR